MASGGWNASAYDVRAASQRMNQVRRIVGLLDRPAKRRLIMLGLLILCHALLEVISVGLVLPFIALIANPQVIDSNKVLHSVFLASGLSSTSSFLMLFGVGLFVIIVCKNLYFYAVLNLQMRFAFRQAARIAGRLVERYLAAPYALHLGRNSADLISRINHAGDLIVAEALLYSIQLASEAAAILGIVIFVFAIEPKLSLMLAAILGSASLALARFMRREMRHLGEEEVRLRAERLQLLQQAFGSIKEVTVLDRAGYFLAAFRRLRAAHAIVQARFHVRSQQPRLVLEVVVSGGVVLAVVVLLIEGRATAEIIGVLGLFAMAAFRILPGINRVVYAYHNLQNKDAAIIEITEDLLSPALADPLPPRTSSPLRFAEAVELRDVSFTYPDRVLPALDHLTLRIGRGEAIGLVGPSGAGKTTIVDLLLGLLAPQRGAVLVDGVDVTRDPRPWRRLIGYVPQTIALIDDTLRRNIALGLAEADIDDTRIWRALDLAHLAEFVRSLPEGLETMLGERGVRLSGGQRQRIGIARALYHDPEVLILDEATSALDHESERQITAAIEALHGAKTLVIIAHRLSTVMRCDRLVVLADGAVADSGSVAELAARRAEFRGLLPPDGAAPSASGALR
jgi:ATP-binding cassette subfamily C protein